MYQKLKSSGRICIVDSDRKCYVCTFMSFCKAARLYALLESSFLVGRQRFCEGCEEALSRVQSEGLLIVLLL